MLFVDSNVWLLIRPPEKGPSPPEVELLRFSPTVHIILWEKTHKSARKLSPQVSVELACVARRIAQTQDSLFSSGSQKQQVRFVSSIRQKQH